MIEKTAKVRHICGHETKLKAEWPSWPPSVLSHYFDCSLFWISLSFWKHLFLVKNWKNSKPLKVLLL